MSWTAMRMPRTIWYRRSVGLPPIAGRSRIVDDLFEYGSRAGFWRVLRLFEERGLHFTSWAVGLALKRNPDAGRAMAEAGHEVASLSWRWTDYSGMPEEGARHQHLRLFDRRA